MAHPQSNLRLPLTGEHERALIAASDSGDGAATEQLVDAFLPSIESVARLYRGFASLEAAELRQQGVVGLLQAAKRYDQSAGTPFWAYASWWVRQAMQQLVADLVGPVVLSDRATRRLVRIKRARGAFQQSHGREPSIADLAKATDLPRDQVEDLVAIERTPRRLDQRPPGGGEGPTFGEGIADPLAEDAYERVRDLIEGKRLRSLSEDLDERERRIVFAHYGIGTQSQQTLREIAGGLDLSVERVRQLEERAFGKLRKAVGVS